MKQMLALRSNPDPDEPLWLGYDTCKPQPEPFFPTGPFLTCPTETGNETAFLAPVDKRLLGYILTLPIRFIL